MSGFEGLTLGDLQEMLDDQPAYLALSLRGAGELWWALDMRVEDELLVFFPADDRAVLQVSTAQAVLANQFSHLRADTPLAFCDPDSPCLRWVVGRGGAHRDDDGESTVWLGF